MGVDPKAKTRVNDVQPDPFAGRTFDGYRIEAVIGRGGMGTVYRARQLSLGRPVAIKILAKELVRDEQFLERFHREAEVLSKLSHPNVVTVFDRGEVDGRPYLVMEFVEGTSLRELMRAGPLPAGEALRIVSSVLAALAHAHACGIIHRDIKPENVLMAQRGVVKVADFGLSRMLGPEDELRLTRTQLVLGTYEYMAPEQRERSRTADSRADLYATGVVLYEMLTSELPIGRFDLPSRRRPKECDARIDAIVARSLEKDPDQRFQKADEMAGAVSAILEDPTPRPAPPSPPPLPPTGPTYKPLRFEYHIDNVATIDHVLGTTCYVLGGLSLFGWGWMRHLAIGAPFLVFLVAGWYLRDTAADLRRFKPAARTSQAVIAILAAFTGILIPFSIYSLWVLFTHRGRTYYAARGRGMDEVGAARHTYRLLEEPYPASTPSPAPSRAPRPSQIPVQSMVTSEVIDSTPRERRSAWVTAGLVLLVLGLLGYGLALASDLPVPPEVLVPVAGAAFLLLLVGLVHSLFTPGVTGAGVAFLVLLILAAVLVWLAGSSMGMQEFPVFRGMRMGCSG